MSEDQKTNLNVEDVLEDGIVTNAVLMQLSEEYREEEETERMINGPLSMVCTYPEGYKERQAVYSCLTCQKETGKIAGVCYACSENCHSDHDIIQLYTKRNFCCDCGNSKFNKKCKLFEEKIDVNRKNTYSHNYRDQYCTCNKTYPPPEDDPMYAAEMYQCIGCEDWFHAVHLGLEDKIFDEDGVEVFCMECVKKFPFVRPYAQVYLREFERLNGPISQQKDKKIEEAKTSKEPIDENQNGTSSQQSTSMFENKSNKTTTDDPNQSAKSFESRRNLIIIDNRESTLDSTTKCYYREIQTSEEPSNKSLWFATCDWRMMLCRCQQCKRMYEDYECEYLLEDADTLTHYLNMNAAELEKNRRAPEEEIFDEVAKRTNVDVAHSVVAEVAVLKRKLTDFMNDMAKQDKIVTKDDVQRFFVEHGAKRQRLNGKETSENDDEE
ncbi:hypothetical protein M3Y94_00668800 [Aphelenchoides besseyi]|nr:hypothetical protein M3Y94_00668800 [Aphelenchoides besseyi]KAI6231317.1 UBR-type domain-containing protein [Aphelenchoides besseyi]